jgi:hypothetical protein
MNWLDGYWYLWPHAVLIGLIVLFYLIRLLLEWWDWRKRRAMQPYVQTWGGAVYFGQHRQNFRRP